MMNIGIVGLGLIGGSLARQFKRNTRHSVYGYDVSADAIAKAELLGAIDGVFEPENPVDLDVVFVALTPIAANRMMDVLAPKLKKGAVIADTAGVKRPIIDHMKMLSERYPDISFVGVHPMAGREYSGISHSTATLFEHAFIIITPVLTDIEAAEKIKQLFIEAVCRGVTMASASEHDKIIAYTSQLAHVVSSAYIQNPTAKDYLGFSAGSFRDMTRVAKLNPDMWTELFLENGDNLLPCIADIIEKLTLFKQALEDKNAEELHRMLAEGNRLKEAAEKKGRDYKNE